jgi:hypothetical protein
MNIGMGYEQSVQDINNRLRELPCCPKIGRTERSEAPAYRCEWASQMPADFEAGMAEEKEARR